MNTRKVDAICDAWWVEPGRILAGPYPGSDVATEHRERARAILDLGILTFINLMEPDETNHSGRPFVPYEPLLGRSGATMHRFPIRDMSIPALDLMKQILQKIDASLAASRPVYIHCWGGRGRTGTVVGCLLVHRAGLSGDEALRRIEALRAGKPGVTGDSPETDEQREFVRSWGEV
jgi:protein-tyrosine phosphatase